MNDINDPNQTRHDPVSSASHAAADTQGSNTIAGFCQNCGKPLTSETIRRVGASVFCEPCLAARLGGAPAGAYASQPFVAAGPLDSGAPNPGLAALLGFIPGVGAMYNGQYAKGIVHLFVFAFLVSLADHVSGIFGLFIAGWIFYMALEAHHTAKARLDGTPLPNPFGLNDIGERFGFGRSWPGAPSVAGFAQDAASAAAAAANSAAQGFRPVQPGTPPGFYPPAGAGPASSPAGAASQSVPWGAPVDAYAPPYTAYTAPNPGYTAPYAYTATAEPPLSEPLFVAPRNRFPAGAVWLIGLGTIFLLATTGLFRGIRGEALIGFLLIGLSAWLFTRRMLETGAQLANDGSAAWQLRVIRALRGSAWVAAIGILMLLNAFYIVRWGHSWPFLIILAGVMTLLERTAYNTVASSAYTPSNSYAAPVPAPVPAPPAEAPGASTSTSIVPSGENHLSTDTYHQGGN